MWIVTIQDNAELLRRAIEEEVACLAQTEERRGARIGAQADDAQAGCSTQHRMQRSRQAAAFKLYDKHLACTRIRFGSKRW